MLAAGFWIGKLESDIGACYNRGQNIYFGDCNNLNPASYL